MTTELHKNGKLLLSGEYAVLDGALSLAMPTQYGQNFGIVGDVHSEILLWRALDHRNELWFEAQINIQHSTIRSTNNPELAGSLKTILDAALQLNPAFKKIAQGAQVTSRLEFPRSWGLGSSSTLIAAIAQWSQTDAFVLSALSFGGSGYDVAAADRSAPFTYQVDKPNPIINTVSLDWPFTGNLYFVHRNQKQNSRDSIAHYRKKKKSQSWIQEISAITQAMIHTSSTYEFASLIRQHEQMIATSLGLTPVQEELFKDFAGAVKSLGGWGGDFVMALAPDSDFARSPRSKGSNISNYTTNYFKEKGFRTIIPFDEMILQQ